MIRLRVPGGGNGSVDWMWAAWTEPASGETDRPARVEGTTMGHLRGFARLAVALAATGALLALTTAGALGARPIKETINLDNPADEAWLSEYMTDECGFPVAADIEGRVTLHVFLDRDGEWQREIDKWWIRDTFTNVETGASILLKDVGPDVIRVDRQGRLTVAITGRSLTGSGVIGRVVIDIDTGEVLHVAGKDVGSMPDQVCAAID